MMESATADLKATGIETHALQVGDKAPDITLPDATGRPVRLADLWRESMTVVIFYRGGWCPYCNLELRAWQHQLDALAQLGGGSTGKGRQHSIREKGEGGFHVRI